ncbi:hypothetical protein CDAR_444231 [Caerostris darwini]|uniref:Uncharacterized protein n=1 Tax=Caerostris darwini TaxID=1538125 RepID=A0AAV4XBL1_9ARAC|nr:hypothetical protein CDAR_444231 [Caerostris darwini]
MLNHTITSGHSSLKLLSPLITLTGLLKASDATLSCLTNTFGVTYLVTSTTMSSLVVLGDFLPHQVNLSSLISPQGKRSTLHLGLQNRSSAHLGPLQGPHCPTEDYPKSISQLQLGFSETKHGSTNGIY